LVTENRLLRNQITGRVRLSDGERKTLAELGNKLGKKALQEGGLCVAMDQKLTLSNLLSRMPLICEEFFNSVAKALLLLFVPKVYEVGVFGSLILERVLADRKNSATRPCGSKGIGGCDTSMKLCSLSSGCESRPAKGEPARAGSQPCAGRGDTAGEA
jgi:hypothetical protein